jgi:hypothetical protein
MIGIPSQNRPLPQAGVTPWAKGFRPFYGLKQSAVLHSASAQTVVSLFFQPNHPGVNDTRTEYP